MSKKFWLGVLYVAVIGALSNVAALFIKRDKLNEHKAPLKPFKWENNGKVYDRLAVRKWKSKVPDMSKILKFLLPKQIKPGTTSNDIKALIKETCVAEIVHEALILLSSAVIFICPGLEGILLFLLCIAGNLPFIIIQRYNRPQYIKAERRLQHREERLGK